jgi:hypothetical protein
MNTILSPTHLENYALPDNDNLLDVEWRAHIKSSTGKTKLRIKYYGKSYKSKEYGQNYELICNTDFAPQLIYAIDPETLEEIVLFDGCKHGYDNMFGDEYTEEQRKNRQEKTYFIDEFGCDTFDIVVKVYHNIDYDDEFGKEYKESGNIKLISGEPITWEKLIRDAFDFFEIRIINENGQETIIAEYELA